MVFELELHHFLRENNRFNPVLHHFCTRRNRQYSAVFVSITQYYNLFGVFHPILIPKWGVIRSFSV